MNAHRFSRPRIEPAATESAATQLRRLHDAHLAARLARLDRELREALELLPPSDRLALTPPEWLPVTVEFCAGDFVVSQVKQSHG
jgi:hypothetical protein